MHPRKSTTSVQLKRASHATRGLTVSLAMVAFVMTAGAQERMPTTEGQRARADNYYAAGNRIEITAPMAGDVVVAGRQIEIVRRSQATSSPAGGMWR
jgi:hypothetical protein